MSERTKKGLLHRTLAWLERNLWWILIGIAVAFIGTTVWFIWYPPQWLKDEHQNVELIKILLLALGGLGGLYGLVIGARRTKNSQEQLFNERLGRGVELLAHKNSTMRGAGIRVLWDLGKTSSQEQAKLIVEIIHDFVRQRATIQDNSDPIPRQDRLDIELGIHAIAGLIEKAKMTADQISFGELDLHGLRFNDLELNRANFDDAKLNGVFFWGAKLQKVSFIRAELNYVFFFAAELTEVNFYGADLSDAYFFASINLSQEQINSIIFEKGRPPRDLPNDAKTGEKIKIPDNRAYTWETDIYGNQHKKFVESNKPWSGDWVDNHKLLPAPPVPPPTPD